VLKDHVSRQQGDTGVFHCLNSTRSDRVTFRGKALMWLYLSAFPYTQIATEVDVLYPLGPSSLLKLACCLHGHLQNLLLLTSLQSGDFQSAVRAPSCLKLVCFAIVHCLARYHPFRATWSWPPEPSHFSLAHSHPSEHQPQGPRDIRQAGVFFLEMSFCLPANLCSTCPSHPPIYDHTPMNYSNTTATPVNETFPFHAGYAPPASNKEGKQAPLRPKRYLTQYERSQRYPVAS
jgi:hypothetical protein